MYLRRIWRKVERFFIYRVLSLNDTPHRIALGVACGLFVTMTPTIGLQMVLTVLLASLLRANRFVGVPFVWITNPLTLVPLYGPSYLLGNWVLGSHYSWHHFMACMSQAVRFSGDWWETTRAWWLAAMGIFWPLWIGSLIVALIVGALAYVLTLWGVVTFRRGLSAHRSARVARRLAARQAGRP